MGSLKVTHWRLLVTVLLFAGAHCVRYEWTFVPFVESPDPLSTTMQALSSSTELIDVRTVEVPMVHRAPPHDCQTGYVYVDGDCRPMLVDRCNLELCGPNSYCYDAKNCACLPGFKWLHAVSSAQGNCVDWHMLKSTARISTPSEAVEEPSGDFWLIGFFASIGIVCIAIAVLVLVIVLYKAAAK